MTIDNIYTVDKTKTIEELLRNIVVKLATDPNSPYDIADLKFGEVCESVQDVFLCRANVELDYTADVGYNTTEQYTTSERQTLRSGEYYTSNGRQIRANRDGNYVVDVTRRRSMTNWQPYSGHINKEVRIGVAPGISNASSDRIAGAVNLATGRKKLKGETADIPDRIVADIKDNCAASIKKKIIIPGDTSKNLRSSEFVELQKIECYRVPYYEVSYTYKGVQYKAGDFAFADCDPALEYPRSSTKIMERAKEASASSRTGFIVAMVLYFMSFYLFVPLSVVYSMWCMIVPLFLYIIAAVCYSGMNKTFDETLHRLYSLKLSKTQEFIKNNGYQGLSVVEASKMQANYDADSEKKSKAALFFMIIGICVYLAALCTMFYCMAQPYIV